MGFPEQSFRHLLAQLQRELQDDQGLWTLRGFIDIARRIYALSSDTKVISKALELMTLPEIVRLARDECYQVVFAPEQNFYPDLSLVRGEEKFALDLKSTYRMPDRPGQVSGFILGAFIGYFRDRRSTKNIVFPYCEYTAHYIIGIVYTKVEVPDLPGVYPLEQLEPSPPQCGILSSSFSPNGKSPATSRAVEITKISAR